MKICEVIARYPLPGDEKFDASAPVYRDIVCENEAQAIAQAQSLHLDAGRRFAGTQFKVLSSKIVLCPTALPEAA